MWPPSYEGFVPVYRIPGAIIICRPGGWVTSHDSLNAEREAAGDSRRYRSCTDQEPVVDLGAFPI